jgi:hypothetical protein
MGMHSNRSVVSGSKLRLRSVLVASAVLAVARVGTSANAGTLTWDSSGTHPTNPVDGSGTWDDSSVRWSTGSADQAWVDGNNAIIGHGNGTAAYTITLGADISPATLTFLNPGNNASYTLDGGANASTDDVGFTLSTTGDWNVSSASVTLTQGTFVNGAAAPTVSTTQNLPVVTPNVTHGGSLTLGSGSVFQTAGIFGDTTSSVHFNGATLQPVNLPQEYLSPILYQTANTYISTGGLTVDTSLLNNQYPMIIDPLLHDPAGAASDGGFTLNGGGVVYMGFDENSNDPINTYNGPTTINNGTLVIDTSGNTAFDPNGVGNPGKGPFANSNFVVNAAGVLNVTAEDGLIGETGTNTVTINGGVLYVSADLYNYSTSIYIGNTTIGDLGTIETDSQSSIAFVQNSVLHVTSSAFLLGNQVGFESGAVVKIDAGAVLMVNSNLIDAAPLNGAGVGQLTLAGSGTLDLQTPLGANNVVGNSFQGPVTINGGNLVLDTANTATGMFPSSPSITVNNGGVLTLGQSNTLIGTDDGSIGSPTAVILNPGGEMIAADGTTNHVANLTLNGGTLVSTGTANSSGSIIFLPTSAINVTANSSISAQGVVLPGGAALNVLTGSTLSIFGTLVDSSTTLTGQLTTTGHGTIQLYGSNTFSGVTNVSSGSVVVESTGSLSKTPSIIVASGASFTDAGALTSNPAVVVNGNATFGPNYNTGIQVLNLASLTIGARSNAANGFVNVSASNSHGNRLLIVTGSLSLSGTANAWTSKLDLGNNDLDVQGGNLMNIWNQLKQGYNAAAGGYWNGSSGIVSSSAANDATHLTTLGVILNTTNGTTPLYGSAGALGLFDGISPAATDVLVKYTYYGDTNLDGKVDGSDYARVDNGFLLKLTGWFNGDFNYDGVVDGSDYTLIDNAFNQQGASLAAEVSPATPTAQIDATTAVPEPATVTLFGLAAIGLLSRRNRRHDTEPTHC